MSSWSCSVISLSLSLFFFFFFFFFLFKEPECTQKKEMKAFPYILTNSLFPFLPSFFLSFLPPFRCPFLHGLPGDKCKIFSRTGSCIRGDKCPLVHEGMEMRIETLPPSLPPLKSQEVCRKFMRGDCTRRNCPFFHPSL